MELLLKLKKLVRNNLENLQFIYIDLNVTKNVGKIYVVIPKFNIISFPKYLIKFNILTEIVKLDANLFGNPLTIV